MFTSLLRLLGVLCLAIAARASSLDREIVLAPHAGAAPEDAEIVRWQARAGEANARVEVLERLGWAYVAKARRTQDAGFYKLAEKTADVMAAEFGPSAEGRLLHGHVLHQLHRFREAEAVARTLTAERGAPADWALLSDVLMEQGQLDDAIAALQRMLETKPGPEALSRAAHLRWLKGDLAGAMEASQAALRAASPRDAEAYAWLLTRMSHFRLLANETPLALALAEAALQQAQDYAPAEFARGRALLASGEHAAALGALRRAVELNALPEYQWWLADALRDAGQCDEAAAIESALKARGALVDPRTLALFLATRGESPVAALRLARAELKERGDVHTHDALAWALCAGGFTTEAERAMARALAPGTRDPRLLLHAGEIALARGEHAAAGRFFVEAQARRHALTPSEQKLLARRLPAAAAP